MYAAIHSTLLPPPLLLPPQELEAMFARKMEAQEKEDERVAEGFLTQARKVRGWGTFFSCGGKFLELAPPPRVCAGTHAGNWDTHGKLFPVCG